MHQALRRHERAVASVRIGLVASAGHCFHELKFNLTWAENGQQLS
jgi:hypothetical protein